MGNENRSIVDRLGEARPWQAGVAVGVLTLLLYLPLIALGLESDRARFDAEDYHLQVVRSFAETWPAADVSDYLSATTPGYHWLLAGVAQLGWSQAVLEIVGVLVTGVLTGLVGWWAARATGRSWAAVAALPIIASPYVVQAGVSVLPDNAGWLGVLALLLMCIGSPPRGARWVAIALTMLALVLVRQSHIWMAGVIVASGWLGPAWTLVPARGELVDRLRRTGVSVLAVVPAVLALGWFVQTWGGLAPPTFTGAGVTAGHPNMRASLSPVAPAYILMLFGVFGVFWLRWWWIGFGREPRRAVVWALIGAAIGLGLAFAGDSTYDVQAGRHGGFWRLIEAGPLIAGRYSVVLIALSSLGGAMVALCGAALPSERRWILLLALAGFASAQVVNANLWQRYYEPMVLILLAVASIDCRRREGVERADAPDVMRRWRILGPLGLTLMLAVLTSFTLEPMA